MNRLTLIVAALALASAPALAAPDAQPAAPTPMIRTLNIAVNDPRPVAAAIIELEQRHGIAISYEDVPLVNAGDIEDVTLQVRRDLDQFPAGKAPAVIVPRHGAIHFSYEADRSTGLPVNTAATLQRMLEAHTGAGNAGDFRVVDGFGITHIVPASVKNAAGVSEAVTPVLDLTVAVPAVNGNGIEALDALCAAVSKAAGVTVVPGTIPANLFGNTHITLPANNAQAREALLELLAQLPAKTSWQLFYDPGMQFYALNIHTIE